MSTKQRTATTKRLSKSVLDVAPNTPEQAEDKIRDLAQSGDKNRSIARLSLGAIPVGFAVMALADPIGEGLLHWVGAGLVLLGLVLFFLSEHAATKDMAMLTYHQAVHARLLAQRPQAGPGEPESAKVTGTGQRPRASTQSATHQDLRLHRPRSRRG